MKKFLPPLLREGPTISQPDLMEAADLFMHFIEQSLLDAQPHAWSLSHTKQNISASNNKW
jgi:hypothetical protein